MKKHSLLNNLFYCLHDVMIKNKRTPLFLCAAVLGSLGEAFGGVLTSYLVVDALSKGADPKEYLLRLALCVGLTFVCTLLRIWGLESYTWYSTFARCSTSWLRLTEKNISTDYLNIEPREKRKAFEKGWMALSSNWVGLESMMKQFPPLVIGFLGMSLYAGIVAFYVPWVLLIMAGMILSSALFAYWGYHYHTKVRDEEERLWNRSYLLKDDATNLENAKEIRAYSLAPWFERVYQVLAKEIFTLNFKVQMHTFLGDLSNNVFLFLRDLFAYALLLGQVLQGNISLANFAFLLGLIAGFSLWVNQFVTAFAKANGEALSVEDYRAALNLPETLNHGQGRDVKSLQKPFEITFKDVCFHYPGDTKEILHSINLVIHPGEKIALVGNNGAGKTTLVKLLCGLYQPTQGAILLNGVDIREFNVEEYLSLISALFQDAAPLAFDIKTNVTCCPEKEADEKRFIWAVKEAGFAEKMDSLPQKENTFVSQVFSLSGVQLSGGENQKLLLARALYKGAPLLVLDEPTSALDPLSEGKMYQNYLSFANGNTSLFISHRLASTRFCDRIVFLEDGRIEEIGTHEELIKGNKRYKEMFDIQAKYYQKEEANHATI
jgi:ATP-binding cassette subfamily B protein